MAKEVVSLTVEVESGQAISATKNLKSELKNATKELQQMLSANKENTQEYIDQRNKVAALQDKMRDFKEDLQALDPGRKFEAIASVAGNIAGGFQAAQGAMALFGTESKDVEKALLKVQAATALAQGIDSIREMGRGFELAKVAIGETLTKQNLLTAATKIYQALASPLGLAIAAASAAIAYLAYQYNEATKATEAQTEANQKSIRDFWNNAKEQDRINRELSKQSNERYALLDKLRRDDKIGKDKELADLKFNLEQQRNELFKHQVGGIQLNRELAKKLLENYEADKLAIEKKYADKAVAEQKKREEDIAKNKLHIVDDYNKNMAKFNDSQLEVEQKQADEIAKIKADADEDEALRLAGNAAFEDEIIEKQVVKIKLSEAEKLAAKKAALDATLQLSSQALTSISQMNEINRNQEIQAAGNNKLKIAEIEKKYFERNKKLQIAQATIATAQAAIQAYQAMVGIPVAGPVLAPIAAGAAVVSGAIQINKIKQTSFDSGGSFSSSLSSSTPTTNATQPQVGRVTQEVTFADRDSINAGGTILKAYVSEQDITASQQRIRQIEERAKR